MDNRSKVATLAHDQLDQLTTEMAWVRRLALALVHDASTADDVAQDAWLHAAGRVPDDRPLRPWLSRVVLNVVRMRGRSAKRREAREAAVPEPIAAPTAAELVDRVELQRMVAGEVLALAEPYRSTVLLHYFEGLSSAEIARRDGLPDGTVRRRLKTALDELRDRIARREPTKQRGVLAVLAPLVIVPGSPAQTAGRIVMKKAIAGLVVVVLLIVGFWTWRSRKGGEGSEGAEGVAGGGGASSLLAGGGRDRGGAPSADRPWFVQRGVADRKIAGRVLFRGAPIAGATVRLGNTTTDAPPAFGGGRPGDEIAVVQSGPDGRFDFGMRPAASFIVSAEADGKTPASVAIASGDPTAKPDQITLELGNCTSRLFGSVVDSSGGGVAKARLRVVGLGGTDSNPSGEYSLCVPMGDSRVRVEADGYGAIDVPIHLVGELRHDFELVPESVLVGTVVDEGNRPVPYARVLALPQAVETPHHIGDGAALADGDGKFRIANLAPGRFLLAAIADGFGTTAPKAAVAAPGTAHEITLIVTHHARVSGRVVMNGQPVGGARISVVDKRFLARGAYSQSDGSFTLEGVPFGKTQLAAGTYEVVTPKDLLVDKASIENVVIEVAELATLRGKVTRHGKPVADVNIQSSIGTQARSTGDGTYEMTGLPTGDIQITAQAFGATNAFSPFTKVTMTAGKVTQYDIDLLGGAEVHGIVVDGSGQPVPNVYVRLIDHRGDLGESMTDAKGAFQCTSMLGGADYRVSVFPSPGARIAFAAAGGTHESISLEDGDTVLKDVKIAIDHSPLAIAGRVVDDKGAPVADVHIEAIGMNPQGGLPLLPSVRADANGQFRIANLAKGAYTMHARAGDGSEAELPNIAAGATNVEIKLVRPGSIEGEIVGFTKTPRVHARQVTATLLLGNEAVLEGNHFTITGLAPGKYVLEALAGPETDGLSVEVKPGAVTRAKLTSRGRGTLEGTVVDFTSRAPIPGMVCVAAQSMAGQAGDVQPGPNAPATDATGAFKIPAPTGKARVMCFSQDGSYSVAGGDVDVPVNAPGRVELAAVKAVPPPSDPGFRIKPLTLPLVIAAVDPNGPAKASGLAVGDRVMTIDGAPLTGLLPSSAMMLAWNHRVGTTLVLGVERAGTPMTIKIVVAKQTN